jgi:hypothetical protein
MTNRDSICCESSRWLQPFALGAALLMVFLVARDSRAAESCCPVSEPDGVWRGKWSSQSTGHEGPLNARIRPAGANQYTAWFYGRFAKVIPFAYRASLSRVPGTTDTYRSSKRLPLLGEYETTATISQDSFQADFVSSQDRGVFTMSRRR